MGVYAGPEKTWAGQTNVGRTHIATKGIVQSGLVLNLDAGSLSSYSGSGTTWTDLSSSGNNGILTNGPTYSNVGGGSIQITDNNDYITINSGLPTGNTWSANIWFLISGPTSFTQTGHRTLLATSNFRFQWDDTNSPTTARGPFVDFTNAAGGGTAQYSTTLSPSDIFNVWRMASVVSNGSLVSIYYGGVTGGTTISASKNFSSDGGMSIALDNRSLIGAPDGLNADGGNVYISNVQIYNRALTATEIQQNFNTLRGRFGI